MKRQLLNCIGKWSDEWVSSFLTAHQHNKAIQWMAFDGVANMAGRVNGIQAVLKSDCLHNDNYIHCRSHLPNLIQSLLFCFNGHNISQHNQSNVFVPFDCLTHRRDPQCCRMGFQSLYFYTVRRKTLVIWWLTSYPGQWQFALELTYVCIFNWGVLDFVFDLNTVLVTVAVRRQVYMYGWDTCECLLQCRGLFKGDSVRHP